jgi:hypothetical protein
MGGQPDALAPRQGRTQQRLACAEGKLAHVVSGEPEHVEYVEEDGDVALMPLRQEGEARLRAVEGNDFAVDGELVARLGGQCVRDLRIARVLRKVVAREHAHGVTVADRQTTHTVELALEDPVRIAESLIGEYGLHDGRVIRRCGGRDQFTLRRGETVKRTVQGSSRRFAQNARQLVPILRGRRPGGRAGVGANLVWLRRAGDHR